MLLVIAGASFAYNNPSLEGKTLKTEHFEVHYHEGAEWTAQQVAQIAEEVHGPLTELYDYEPANPVHFVIRDTHDYANGAAYFFDDKVEIWATNLEFGLRGTSDWLRNVVTHEYAHIISIQASLKFTKRVPAIYFQMVTFEKERRPDVLRGYPKDIISYPISGVVMPPWFAEGVAQYQTSEKRFDCWDTHRDMILRAGLLEDDMLTYNEMLSFGGTSLENEQVYDHGFGLVRYIAETYGDSSIADIAAAMRKPWRFTFDGALKSVTHRSGKDLYNDWRAGLDRRYEAQIAEIRPNARVGRLVAEDGFMTIAPAFSPDGQRIAYLSNGGGDHAATSLYVMERLGTDVETIAGGVTSAPQWSPDGRKIVYSRKHTTDRYGSTVNDIFVYDLVEEKEKAVTKGLRAGDPDFSPDGGSIVCVVNGDGTHRLYTMNIDGGNQRELLSRDEGTQLYAPHFSPDGERVLFGIFESGTRDIAMISSDGSGFEHVLSTENDERDARWARSGDAIIFASDRSGIFNIYELDLDSGFVTERSNVIGGAFMPDLSRQGDAIVYAGYSSEGYGVYVVDATADPVATLDALAYSQRATGQFEKCAFLKSASAGKRGTEGTYALAAADLAGTSGAPGQTGQGDKQQTDVPNEPVDAAEIGEDPAMAGLGDQIESVEYSWSYTPFQFYPRLVVWDGDPRLGLILSSYELLDKQSFFVAGDADLGFSQYNGYIYYELRQLYPTLYADFYITRERTSDSTIDEEPASPTYQHSFDFDVRYDLWAATFGAKIEFAEAYSYLHQHELNFFYGHQEYNVNLSGNEYQEDGTFQTSFSGGWKYFVGNEFTLQWNFRTISPAADAGINPRGGRSVRLQLMHADDDLFTSGEFEYGFRPSYTNFNFNQFTIDWREYIGLPWWRHSLRLRLYASIIDRPVDNFFWVYMGGRDGIRGYTYYSIGGRKGALASLTYRFPIWRNIGRQLWWLSFKDIYGGVFGETADAWEARGFQTTGYKNSAGVELRAEFGSYYVFPTSLSFVAAYAFDNTQFLQFVFGGLPVVITQEEGWSYYFTLAFGFDL